MDALEQYDLIIVGGGPAGYSAGLYGARASLNTLVLEQGMPGGQIATSDVIDNYPGILSISGAEIGQRMQEHAVQAGANNDYGSVTSIEVLEDGSFTVVSDMGSHHAKAVIVATGATPRTAGFEGEDAYRGRGVSYCATCDGMFYKGKHVFLIGGGNSAVEEAIYLSNIASHVEVILRRDVFRASRGMVERMLSRENITVRYQTSIVATGGGTFLNEVTFRDNTKGTEHTETFAEGSFGIFVATGHDPATGLVQGLVDLGPDKGIVTDASMATKTPGLYAAGDVRSKALRQVVTAAADGAIAAMSAYRYIEDAAK